jgi:myo-inositol-1(or 4)-monophosphatase
MPYWLVDPICGTRNFASGIPLFAVNAALVEDGRVTASVVGDGSTGDVLVAEVGNGGWRVGEAKCEPLAASETSLIVDFGAWPKGGPERERAARQFGEGVQSDRWEVRCLSTTLSLVYVATGQIAGCVLFAAPDLVHIAAGSLLIAEAGGHVTDVNGTPWSLRSTSLVCSAGAALQRQILELVGA